MNNQLGNPYTVLGVPPTASSTQVREAYRRLAKQFHPDRHSDAQATERMQRINQAWQTLSSPAARARHDAAAAVAQPAVYPHWGGAPRASQSPYTARQTWRASQSAYAAEAMRDEGGGPLQWGLVVVAVPVVVLVTALFGGLAPLPILGLLIFFLARAVFRTGD
jgi:curved DNA-binding protein CbpA